MSIEITVRLSDADACVPTFIAGLVDTFGNDIQIAGRVCGGVYFTTTASPAEFFVWAANEGFDMSDFENVTISNA